MEYLEADGNSDAVRQTHQARMLRLVGVSNRPSQKSPELAQRSWQAVQDEALTCQGANEDSSRMLKRG